MNFRVSDKKTAEFIKKNFIALAIPGGNNMWTMSASGKVLKDQYLTDKALQEFKSLPEAERKPNQLAPLPIDSAKPMTPPKGGLVVRQYLRYLGRDAKGELCRLKEGVGDKLKLAGPGAVADASGPNRDFVWLTEAEWKSLVPRTPSRGQQLAVGGALAKRIFTYHLYDGTTGCGWMWQLDHLQAGELTLTVEEATATGCRMRLEGFARLFASKEWKAEFRLLGFLHYDHNQKAFDRFDAVAIGDCWYPSEGSKQPVTLGFAFELAPPGSSGYGSPPYRIRMDDGNPAAYFALKD
jgi:hypothetical protein